MTGGSEALARAAAHGASAEQEIEVRLLHAGGAHAHDLLNADGYIFVFPENLAAISGVMKAFFDRCYYPCLGQIEGQPYALLVCAGSDGTTAAAQAERIATGWRLKKIAESLIIRTNAQTPDAILAPKTMKVADLQKASETGAILATGLTLGVF